MEIIWKSYGNPIEILWNPMEILCAVLSGPLQNQVYMDLHGFGKHFSDSGAWVPDPLWQPVAGCGGKLWPLYTTMLGPWGLQAGWMVSGRMAVWLDGWMAGWKAGWMAGWMAGWLDGWMVGITTVT